METTKLETTCRKIFDVFENNVRRLVPLGALVLYTFFGAFLFHLIEEPHELNRLEELTAKLDDLDALMARNLSAAFGVSNQESYDQSLELLEDYRKLLGVKDTDSNPRFSFWGSLFYSFSLYTTIGYGYQAPKTFKGRFTSIIYAYVGIPLYFYAMIQIGFMLASFCRLLWAGLLFLFGLCRGKPEWQKVNFDETVSSKSDQDLLHFPVTVTAVVCLIWLFASAGFFLLWQTDWDYRTSLYFMFLSLTTIGLGDVTPLEFEFEYRLCYCCTFILIGMSFFSSCVTLFQMKRESLHRALQDQINERYKSAQCGEDQPMSVEPAEIDKSIDRLLGDLPKGSHTLYWLLPQARKDMLKRLWLRKAEMCSAETQTESLLKPSGVQRIRGPLGKIEEDWDVKSRDDVNSLVMMCDYTLR